MGEKSILKEKLIKIKANNYLLENKDHYFKVALQMTDNLGSLDSEFRDDLIYTTFYHWIIEDRFTVEQLKCLLNICLDKTHLFYKLQDEDEDAIFTRTFSVLIVALVLYKHREIGILSEKELYEVKDKLMQYMLTERDVRGYVDIKGWAHSAAHTADALDELVQCSCFNTDDLMDVLNSIKAKVCIDYYVYVDEEDERMITAVESAINRKILSKSQIIHWLQGFKIEKPNDKKKREYWRLRVNMKTFLRSLYFRLLEKEDLDYAVNEVKMLLNEL